MTNRRVWFITGAGRGMGKAFAKAALAAGDAVVATGRRPDDVVEALGQSDQLLGVRLGWRAPPRWQAASCRYRPPGSTSPTDALGPAL